MVNNIIDIEHYKNQLDPHLPNHKLRQVAMDHALKFGLPKNNAENWRYTNLKPLLEHGFSKTTSLAPQTAPLPKPLTAWPRLVFINGVFQPKQSDPMPTSLKMGEKSLAGQKDTFESDHILDCLNIALESGGVNFNLPSGANEISVEILFLFNGTTFESNHIRNSFNLATGTKLNIAISYATGSSSMGWINVSNKINIEDDAELVFYNLTTCPNSHFVSIQDQANIKAGSYENHAFILNTPSARHEIGFETASENAKALINGAMLGSLGEVFDILTRANHTKPNCDSEQFFKSIVDQGGKTSFQGRVYVAKDAQKTNANQACNNIILSRNAEANIKPELLIYADDVKCAHGTTVGELDEKALFYLQQRGISPRDAKTILVNAFLEDILEKLPEESVQETLREMVAQWMSNNRSSM